MYIWLTAPLFTFNDWKIEVLWSFIDALTVMVDGWSCLSSLWSHDLIGGWNLLTLNIFLWYGQYWTHLSYHVPLISLLNGVSLSPLFTLPMTLFTLQGVVFFTFIMRLFSQVFCLNMFIRSRTIIPRIINFISFCLVGFWESWLFNYPLNFILYFPTQNLMDWHGTKFIPSFDVSWTYVSNLIPIR